jgi:DNA-binding MarR family transcriptional regulator
LPSKISNASRQEPTPRWPKAFQVTGGVPVRRFPAPLARRFQQICVAMISEALSGENLTQIEFAALAFLDDMPGIDQRSLAAALGIDRNNASQVLDALEKRSLVDRRINGEDRRARKLHLTKIGSRTVNNIRPKTRAMNERILEPLTPSERRVFIDLLVRLIEGNSEYARPGAGRRKRGALKSRAK